VLTTMYIPNLKALTCIISEFS